MHIPIKFFIYYNKYIKRRMKFIPIIGLILLVLLFSSQNKNSGSVVDSTDNSIFDFIKTMFLDFTNSFDFSDRIQLFTTILLIITIWTGYKYWLIKVRVIRRNAKLVDNLVFAILLIVFSEHINFNSKTGEIFDFGLFLIVLYTVIAGTWLLMKIIDSFNLESDLNCWGLRILGLVLMILGIIMFMGSALGTMMMTDKIVFGNIFWIIGLCIVALGLFSEYRSTRRYGVFVYMR